MRPATLLILASLLSLTACSEVPRCIERGTVERPRLVIECNAGETPVCGENSYDPATGAYYPLSTADNGSCAGFEAECRPAPICNADGVAPVCPDGLEPGCRAGTSESGNADMLAMDAGPLPEVDAGPPVDAGPVEDAGPNAFAGLSAWSVALVGGAPVGTMHDVDLSCRGSVMAPAATGGDPAMHPFLANSSGTGVPNVLVEFFFGNEITAGCETPACASFTSLADPAGGGGMLLDPTAWFAYRSSTADDSTFPVTQRNVVPEAAGISISAIDQTLFGVALTSGGATRDAGTAIVLGTAQDCNGNNLAGIQYRLFDSTGEITEGATGTDTQFMYWPGTTSPGVLPDVTSTETAGLGRFAAANVPATTGTDTIRVEAWTTDATPALIGCEVVNGFADTINVVVVGPRRADGPSGCGI